MGRARNRSQNGNTTFEANLVAGLLNQQRQRNQKFKHKINAQKPQKTEQTPHQRHALPETKYVNARGAAQYLGISKATFFRLKAKGHFRPSPITGRYHLDDLDSHAK
jgi:hypothetical protein